MSNVRRGDDPPGVQLEKQAPGEVVPAVLEAELVDDRDGAEPPKPGRAGVLARWQRVDVITQLGSSSAAEVAARRARKVLRAGWTTGQGLVAWARRAQVAATHGVLREQVRLARISGSAEAVLTAAQLLETAKNARMKRLLDLPRAVLGVMTLVGILVVVLFALLLSGAVIAQFAPGGTDWVGWWAGVGTLFGLIGALLHLLVVVLAPLAALPLLVLLAWREGDRVANPPMWLLTAAERTQLGGEVTPSKVVTALRDLGIPALRLAIKEMGDAGAGMLSPITVAGCGMEVDARLPSGVSTAEVLKRRKKLAENLDRHEHEVFPTVAAARTVRMWIADSGALDQPIGPSPLVIDSTLRANYRTGRAPWGQNLRGDATAIALYQRHLLVTGLSNQGKTAALRALALWLCLDPAPVFRIADLKGFGDWSMFAPLAEVLIEGPTDEHVIAATEMLEAGVAEMERRIAGGITEPPMWLIVDEAQVAYMCPEIDDEKRPYGGQKATSRFFMAARKLHNQGRVVNVLLWQGTQDPTNSNLPKIVREGAHIRASLAVGTEEQARMALGDKAVDGGAAPNLLRQGLDKGTLVVTGDGVDLPEGQAAITIRTHFVDTDAAAEVARRVVERRRKRRLRVVTEQEGVDHLEAFREALRGEPRVRTAVMLGRLIEQDATLYEPWGFQDLKAALEADGLSIRKFDGHSVVRSDDVHRALERRRGDGG